MALTNRTLEQAEHSWLGFWACMACVQATLCATAATNIVFQPLTGNWNVAANWSLGVVPTTNYNPIIQNAEAATINSDVGACASLFVGQGNVPNSKARVLLRHGGVMKLENLLLGRDGTNYGQFDQMGGVLTVTGCASIGDAAGGGSGASGEFNLSAGTLLLPGSAALHVGNLGAGRLLVCGAGAVSTPAIYLGNTAGSSGSRIFQWGGSVTVGDFTIGSVSASNVCCAISAGALQWSGKLLLRDTLAVQGSQPWLQRANPGGVGLELANTATLRFELDARGIAPVQLPGSQISIAARSRLVLDGSRWSRWTGQPATLTLVRHGGYAAQTHFATNNVVFTGFGSLVPSLRYNADSIELSLVAPVRGSLPVAQGVFLEYWELPINDDGINRGQVIKPPLAALPDFTNTLVITHPVFGRAVANIGLSERLRDTNYFLRFTGCLEAPADGAYTLCLNSADGSKLWLDGALVVTNDGCHAPRETANTLHLAAGRHPIQVGCFHNTGTAALELYWAGPGFGKQLVPDSALFLSDEPNLPARQAAFRNVTCDQDMVYNYAPSFIYDETEGLYKIWMCTGGAPGTGPGDYIIYKEAVSLEGLLSAPLQIALAPSHDPAKFDQVHACDPNVYRVGDLYYLTYSGSTDSSQLPERTRIGMAVSYDRGRTFQRLHGGVHIIEPNTNAYAGGYGDGQSAVVKANDGHFYMIYTDYLGGTNVNYQRVVRSHDPAFSPGSFTNVASLQPKVVGNSVDLLYDAANSQFIVVNGLMLNYFDANWNFTHRRIFTNPFDWFFGEGHALLADSQKRPINYNQEGSPCYVFAAATVEDTNNTTLWANWVEGDLKYLVLPQTNTPALSDGSNRPARWRFRRP